MDDCLEEFKLPEMLDEDNKYYCGRCKEHVIASKQLEIFRLPPVLVISLKRFKGGRRSMYSGGGGAKLDTLVEFPVE